MVQHGDMNQGLEMVRAQRAMARKTTATVYQMASNIDDQARDHHQRNDPLKLGELIPHGSCCAEFPIRMGVRGGVLRMRRNRSNSLFEDGKCREKTRQEAAFLTYSHWPNNSIPYLPTLSCPTIRGFPRFPADRQEFR